MAAGPVPGGLLQCQLRQLIGEILTDADLAPELRVCLFRHLAENPKHPEEVLLAHLREAQAPLELPPFTVCRDFGLLPAAP